MSSISLCCYVFHDRTIKEHLVHACSHDELYYYACVHILCDVIMLYWHELG